MKDFKFEQTSEKDGTDFGTIQSNCVFKRVKRSKKRQTLSLYILSEILFLLMTTILNRLELINVSQINVVFNPKLKKREWKTSSCTF